MQWNVRDIIFHLGKVIADVKEQAKRESCSFYMLSEIDRAEAIVMLIESMIENATCGAGTYRQEIRRR